MAMEQLFQHHLKEFYDALYDGDVARATLHLDGSALARDCVIDGLSKAWRANDLPMFEALVAYLCERRAINTIALACIFEDSPAPWVTRALNHLVDLSTASKALFYTICAERMENMEAIMAFLMERRECWDDVDDVLGHMEHKISEDQKLGYRYDRMVSVYQRARAMQQAAILMDAVTAEGATAAVKRM